MATNEFVTTPVASYLWAENPPARNHHAMPECSNYRSSGLGLKPRQWRASVRVLNPAKAEEQYQYGSIPGWGDGRFFSLLGESTIKTSSFFNIFFLFVSTSAALIAGL